MRRNKPQSLLCSFAIGIFFANSLINPIPIHAQESVYDLHDNVILHARKGEAYIEAQQYYDALVSLQTALQLNPFSNMSASIYNNLGLSYYYLGEYPLALASFQHAARIQPNYELYYKNMVMTYATAKTLPHARQSMESILQANPDNSEIVYLLALITKEQGEKKMAKAYFERFLALKPHAHLAQSAKHHLHFY